MMDLVKKISGRGYFFSTSFTALFDQTKWLYRYANLLKYFTLPKGSLWFKPIT